MTNRDNFNLDKEQKAFLKHQAFHGNEIVANTRPPVPDEHVPAQYRRNRGRGAHIAE